MLIFSSYWALSILTISILFRILHLPGSRYIYYFGTLVLGTGLILLIKYLIEKPKFENETDLIKTPLKDYL
jgi:hypothetical protein